VSRWVKGLWVGVTGQWRVKHSCSQEH